MTVSVSLRSDAAELHRLIGFAEEFARRNALSGADRSRLLIILEELFTNTVGYGYVAEAPMGTIEIALACESGGLRIDYSDDGQTFDPLNRPLPDFDQPAEDRPIGGLGLHILRSLVDEARYSRDGDRNHLVLIVQIARPE